ncbi:MAG: Response regulator PleD [Pseudomonadota bacterium]|jgi:two-component system cell cycle response regulator
MTGPTTSSDVRLLLVDDDASAIQVMSRMLAQFPDQRFATNGATALRLAQEATPDLIVLDAEMSGMSGFSVFAALQADPTLARVPVIFATSHRSSVIEQAVLQQGAVDFVTKPLDAELFLARVQTHLRNREFARRRPAANDDTVLPHDAAGRPAAARLLLVDDNVAAIQVLSHTLSGLGDCHFAKTGAEALRLADELQPQIILLDAHLPDRNGFDICAELRTRTCFERVPIVIITRFSDLASEVRALALGASDFIAKPYTPAVLLARVSNLLALVRRGGGPGRDTSLIGGPSGLVAAR